MIKRIATGLAIFAFVLVLGGGTASAGTRVTGGPSGDMTHNGCDMTHDRCMTHN